MRAFLAFSLVLVAACSSSVDAGSGPSDGSADSATDGLAGCVSPKVGDACTASDVLCAGYEGGCCAGYVWTCNAATSTWMKSGLGCPCTVDAGTDAGPFACGKTETCSASEYCSASTPGDGGTTFGCVAIPDACKATPTCDCVKAHVFGCSVSCAVDSAGHLSVGCGHA